MKKFGLLLVLASMFSALIEGQSPGAPTDTVHISELSATHADVAAMLIQSEREAWEAWKRNDVAYFAHGLQPGFKYSESGKWRGKADFLLAIRENKLANYDLRDFAVSFPGGELAVVRYHALFERLERKRPRHKDFTIQSTWKQTGGQWVCANYAATENR